MATLGTGSRSTLDTTPAQATTSTAQAGQIDLGKVPQWNAQTGTAAKADPAATYTAAQRQVGDNEMVSGLVGKYLASDSPLVQQAQTTAQQAANARGLSNSSMAAGAGYQAAVTSVLPIAQADAATYTTAARDNQLAESTARQTNTAAVNDIEKFNAANEQSMTTNNMSAVNSSRQNNAGILAQAQTQNANNQQTTGTFNAQQTNAQSQFNASAANDILKTKLDGQNKETLMNIEASYKTLLSANDAASSTYQQMMKSISDTQNNDKLTGETKAAMIRSTMTLGKIGLGLIGATSNIPGMGDILNVASVDLSTPSTNKGLVSNINSANVKTGATSSYQDGSTTSDNKWIVKNGKWVKNI